jgi:acyl-[acyl-carrier-protein]-phospholipid O-acyltransferase / long-chain-fatty-acid--[acyl-carrier-protein] ligase
VSHSQFSLIKSRRFLPLFLTQFLGAFNNNFFKNALVILMTYRAAEKISVDPRILVTAAAGIFILPFFLFSATAGQLADKFGKARLMSIIKFIELPLMLLAAAGFIFENYWMLLAMLFFVGTQAAFFGPLKYSSLPEMLEEKELIGGNALIEAGTFLAILLGTIFGGILVLKDGGIIWVCSIMGVAALLGWLASLKIPRTEAVTPGLNISPNFIAEAWRQAAYAYKEKDVFLSIIGISWFWLVGFTFLAQFPVYAKTVLGANEEVVTLFLTVFSVGIAIGSLICNRLLKGEVSGVYVPLGAFGMTAGIFLFWLSSPSAVLQDTMVGFMAFIVMTRGVAIVASLFAIAVFGGIYIVPLYAIMQARSDAAHRSRAVAVNNIINALFMVGGAVFTMLLLKIDIDVTDIFMTIGIINIPVAFLVRRIVKTRRAAKGLV